MSSSAIAPQYFSILSCKHQGKYWGSFLLILKRRWRKLLQKVFDDFYGGETWLKIMGNNLTDLMAYSDL